MKLFFWIGVIGLFLFEIANVYFIMPMPGSQDMNSIDLAYFLYRWRWVFRILFLLMIIIGLMRASWKRKWLLAFPLLVVAMVFYMANFKMAADHMFFQPKNFLLANASENKVDLQRLVIGVTNNGESKAYPIQFLAFHHQVRDSIGGKPVLVTYCSVCRSGRVYEPQVNNKPETFRLVGMDHFNAMFEDATTKSWWRQATGEAITGKLKGQQLPEVFSEQMSLETWIALHPTSFVMQPDPEFVSSYGNNFNFENGTSKSKLTGTDTSSWKEKSWVVGIKLGEVRKTYDWRELKTNRILSDKIGTTSVIIVLSKDEKSFFAFELPPGNPGASLRNDTLIIDNHLFRIDGKALDSSAPLKRIPAYQEFWHSWRTFNRLEKK